MPKPNKIRELSEAEAADAELRASMDLALEEARVKASQDRYERESRAIDRAHKRAATRATATPPTVKAAPASSTQGGPSTPTVKAAPASSTLGGPSTSSGSA